MFEVQLHTPQTAPAESRPWLETARETFGILGNLQRVQAESPALLEGYLTLWRIFGQSCFDPVERQVVFLTANYENDCSYCMAGHTLLARKAGMTDAVLEALREGTQIPEAKLEALRRFTAAVVTRRGRVEPGEVDALLAAGYSRQAAMEVVLGVAIKTLSSYTNHIADTPLDGPLQPMAWTRPDRRGAGS